MGLGVAKDVGVTGLFVEGLETLHVFSVVWRGRLQTAFDQDMIACMGGLKGSYVSENIQLCRLLSVCRSVRLGNFDWPYHIVHALNSSSPRLITHAERPTGNDLFFWLRHNVFVTLSTSSICFSSVVVLHVSCPCTVCPSSDAALHMFYLNTVSVSTTYKSVSVSLHVKARPHIIYDIGRSIKYRRMCLCLSDHWTMCTCVWHWLACSEVNV